MALGGPIPDKSFPVLVYNMERADEFVNSDDLVYIDRFDKARRTIAGLTQDFLSAIQAAGGVSLGVWMSGVTQFNDYNEYAVYNGIPYKPKKTTPLPYTAQGVDPTVLPDSDFVQPYVETTEQDVKEAEERSLDLAVKIYRGDDGIYVKSGDTVPNEAPPYTHLTILIDGKKEDVEMTSPQSGTITALASTIATIGGVSTGLMRVNGDIFCAIRQTSQGGGWEYIQDGTHQPNGFSQPITVDGSRNLIIPVDGLRSKVGSVSITPDETLARKVSIGASVDTDEIRARIFAPLTIAINTNTLAISVSDFNVNSDISVSKVDGVLTVGHPINAIISSHTDERNITSIDGAQYVISSRNAFQTVIEEVRPWCCNIKWDGAAWVVTSGLKSEPAINAAGGGFQVVHGLSGFNLPQVSMNLNNGYQAVIDNANGGTSFYVRFRDGAGNAVGAPDANMSVNLSMPIMVKQNTITGNLQLYVGMIQVHPDNVFGSTSNFWISGKIR